RLVGLALGGDLASVAGVQDAIAGYVLPVTLGGDGRARLKFCAQCFKAFPLFFNKVFAQPGVFIWHDFLPADILCPNRVPAAFFLWTPPWNSTTKDTKDHKAQLPVE